MFPDPRGGGGFRCPILSVSIQQSLAFGTPPNHENKGEVHEIWGNNIIKKALFTLAGETNTFLKPPEAFYKQKQSHYETYPKRKD